MHHAVEMKYRFQMDTRRVVVSAPFGDSLNADR
jgi:hypothetical protein